VKLNHTHPKSPHNVNPEFWKGPADEADLDAHRPLTSLFRLALRRRRLFLAVLALAGFSSLLMLAQPLLYREAVNDVAGVFIGNDPGEAALAKVETSILQDWGSKKPHTRHSVAHRTPRQAMVTLTGVVILLLLISLIASFASAWAEIVASRAGHGMERAVILAAFRRALRLPLSRDGADRATHLAKQVDQIDQVEPVVNMLALKAGPEVLRLAGILVIMLYQNPLLAALALAPLPFYAWVAVTSTRRLGVGLDSYYQLFQAVTGRINESLAGLKTVRACGAADRELAALGRETRAGYEAAVQRDRLGSWALFGQDFFVQVSKALVLLVGGWKAFERQLTPGDVVMLVAYIDQVYGPLDSLSSMGVMIQDHVGSFRRGLRLAVRKPDASGTERLRPAPHQTVFLDGQDLRELKEDDLRKATALVSADGILFSSTLKQNLLYQAPQSSDRDAWKALSDAGLTQVVRRLPQGLETPLVDGHGPLSLGERQRLQIARALLAKPRLLVLDEATANLDKDNEARVLRMLKGMRGRCTVLALTHRPALAQGADRVIVIEKGRVGAVGTPREVVRRNAYFRKMVGIGGKA